MSQEELIRPQPRPQVKHESEDVNQSRPRPRSERPERQPSPEPVFTQHVRLIDVDKPVGRVICECWYCKQGLLIEHQREPQQEVRVNCPNCGKVAIKLQIKEVLSVNAIPSPWK
jgi:predicted RNA-binding Zn-ribbon protein involved in translation (DUF1610 family)